MAKSLIDKIDTTIRDYGEFLNKVDEEFIIGINTGKRKTYSKRLATEEITTAVTSFFEKHAVKEAMKDMTRPLIKQYRLRNRKTDAKLLVSDLVELWLHEYWYGKADKTFEEKTWQTISYDDFNNFMDRMMGLYHPEKTIGRLFDIIDERIRRDDERAAEADQIEKEESEAKYELTPEEEARERSAQRRRYWGTFAKTALIGAGAPFLARAAGANNLFGGVIRAGAGAVALHAAAKSSSGVRPKGFSGFKALQSMTPDPAGSGESKTEASSSTPPTTSTQQPTTNSLWGRIKGLFNNQNRPAGTSDFTPKEEEREQSILIEKQIDLLEKIEKNTRDGVGSGESNEKKSIWDKVLGFLGNIPFLKTALLGIGKTLVGIAGALGLTKLKGFIERFLGRGSRGGIIVGGGKKLPPGGKGASKPIITGDKVPKTSTPTIKGGGLAKGLTNLAKGAGIAVAGTVATMGLDMLTDTLEENESDGLAGASDTLSHTIQGASYGAMIGSIVPGVGTAAGAAVGGVIGGAMGIWKNKDRLITGIKNFFGGGKSTAGSGNNPASSDSTTASPPKIPSNKKTTTVVGMDDVKAMVKRHEGKRNSPYKDSVGLWTVGYGHLITKSPQLPPEWNRRFSDEEIDALFEEDFEEHKKAAEKIPGYNKLNKTGQGALIDLTFNMGPAWYKKWPNFTKNLSEGNVEGAARSLESSKWYQQVKGRAPEIVAMIRAGGVGGGVPDVGSEMIAKSSEQENMVAQSSVISVPSPTSSSPSTDVTSSSFQPKSPEISVALNDRSTPSPKIPATKSKLIEPAEKQTQVASNTTVIAPTTTNNNAASVSTTPTSARTNESSHQQFLKRLG